MKKTELKRTAFKPKPTTFGAVRATGKPRQKAMKSKKIPPTAEEKRWMDAIAEVGCCVCMKFHQVHAPPAVHHIVEGGRRLGHFYTIPLCDPGHHQNSPTPQKISRHPYKARFEKKYGTEYELLEYVHANGLSLADIEGQQIRHKCDNPPCINPRHLEVGTHADNMHDMFSRGRRQAAVGEKASKAKLSEKDVRDIRMRVSDQESDASIARDYKVNATTIRAVRLGLTWSHL